MTETRRPSIDIQARDLELLRDLFECRVMTVYHISDLHFGGRIEAARKRVQRLLTTDHLRRRTGKVNEPAVYVLTRRSFELLTQHGLLQDYPRLSWAALEKRVRVSPLTIAHELAVQDVRAAFTAAARRAGYAVVEFSTWPRLFEFVVVAAAPGRGQTLVKPDGFVRLHEQRGGETFEHLFFVEVDRSTEAQEVLAERAAGYLEFYRSGGMAARHGRPRSEFKDYPFRVLMVFRNAERRNNAAARMLQHRPAVLTMAWLATMDEFLKDPFAAVWVRPADYREATKGTAFDPDLRPGFPVYRRRPERESHVERAINKHPLCGS